MTATPHHPGADLPASLADLTREPGDLTAATELWRTLALADATRVDPAAPLGAPPDPRDRPYPLPRISLDLPGSWPGGEVAPAAPAELADLQVQSILGEGGMGRVFLARQRSLDRDVAIKTLRDHAPGPFRDALLAEATVTGSLEHPGIIPVHALGLLEDGRPVLVMKRVDGVTWHDLLADPSHPAWEGWGGTPQDRLEGHLEILMQVCNAAHYGHSRGIVHRDIKPQNVLIGPFGEVYLADWGLAVAMTPGARSRVCGTPGYMAPEMALGLSVDARTDVYLLGATLHEVLTGQRRHAGASMEDLLAGSVRSLPADYPAQIPAALAALANQATARNPALRPPSAAAFRKAVGDTLRHRSASTLLASALPRLARLQALVQGPSPLETAEGSGRDRQREQDRLIIEIRFALDQALKDSPDHPEVRVASETLEALVALRQERTLALERMAKDLDPRVASRERSLAITALLGGALAAALPILVYGPNYVPTPASLLAASFVPLGVLGMAVLVLRRQLWKNTLSRRTTSGLLTLVGAVTLSRALGVAAGLPASAMLMGDALMATTLGTFATLSLTPSLWVCTLTMATTALACALAPARAFLWFSLGSALALVSVMQVARNLADPRRKG